jgi:hypothetical protein
MSVDRDMASGILAQLSPATKSKEKERKFVWSLACDLGVGCDGVF